MKKGDKIIILDMRDLDDYDKPKITLTGEVIEVKEYEVGLRKFRDVLLNTGFQIRRIRIEKQDAFEVR